MERDSGFYWVRRQGGSWIIAEYDAGDRVWFLAGNENEYVNSEFIEIDDNPLTRSFK